jgi:hypothetical protein
MLGPCALCDLTLTSAPSTGNCCYDAIVDEPQVSYHGNIFVLVDPCNYLLYKLGQWVRRLVAITYADTCRLLVHS